MKDSIRFKLVRGLICLVLFFVMLSWVLNNVFLEDYYLYNKKNTLLDNLKKIDGLYEHNNDTMYLELEKIERMKGLHIVIVDRDFNIVYDSMQKKAGSSPRARFRLPERNIQNAPEFFIREKVAQLRNEGTIIENGKDIRMGSNFLSLFSTLYNGDYIYLNTAVAAIEENVDVANEFFLFTGAITLLTGSIFIFLFARKFTKPILKLNSIAQRMSTLDFSERYNLTTKDEIAQLGQSINSLSEQLEESITELRDANEMLKEDIEKERKIDEMRKEFISSVSHELKTPIALIQGYAEGLKINVNDDEENKNFYCDVIVDEACKMNKLVKQLLGLSQIQSGELILDRSDFKILNLIEQVVKKNDLIFKEKGISLSVEKNVDVMVNADYDRIEQIFSNYINNAINHVDNNGIIRVFVNTFGSKCVVSVYNSGQNIKEEHLEKIWTSFYKIDKSRTREYGGSGLGLSIVKAIQQAHCNDYGVKNAEGGVEFWFNLDLVDGCL